MHAEVMGLALAGIGLLGLACQWLAWRLKLPAILFLLIAGFLVGPVTHIFHPNDLFGDLLFPLISLAVAVILFEGSLTLNFKEIRGVGRSVQNIVSIGALISWAVTSIATYYLLNFDWPLALLFGSLTVVTGPTVVVPLLRTVRPQAKLANVLRWEGILIDPIGALFIVIVYEFIVTNNQGLGLVHSMKAFGLTLLIGFSLGISIGAFLAKILRHHWIPEYLQPFAVLTMVLGAFATSNALEAESGLLTVTVMGMWLANAKGVNIRHILHFKEHLTILLISGLFIMLSARMELSDFSVLGISSILLFLVVQLVSRPLAIFVSTIRSKSLNTREKLFISWVAPRGIVAASISSLFAIKLSQAGVEYAELLVPLTFMVIVGTVILQSLTARPVAKLLNVDEPLPQGYLIVGANDVGRTLALALDKYGYRVVVTDSNWDYIKKARMLGLETYYGNPVSTHAEEYLNLIGVGNLLAVSPDKHFNVIAANYFAKEFGEQSIYCLNGSSSNQDTSKHEVGEKFDGSILFGDDISYKKMASLINQGAEIKHTKLSSEFKWEDYVMKYIDGPRIPLFTIDPKGNIHIMSPEKTHTTGEGWTVVSLIKSDASTKK